MTAALAQGPSILPRMGEAGRQAWERHEKSGKTQLGWESTQTSLVLSYPQGQLGAACAHRPNVVGCGVSWPEHRIGGQEAGQSGQLPSFFFLPFSSSPPLPAPLTFPHIFPPSSPPPSFPSLLLPPPLFFPLASQNPCHPRASPVVPRDHRCSFSHPEVPPHSPASSPSPDSGDQIRV